MKLLSKGLIFSVAVLSARQHEFSDLGGLPSLRRLVRLGRHGLGVMREPGQAALAPVECQRSNGHKTHTHPEKVLNRVSFILKTAVRKPQ